MRPARTPRARFATGLEALLPRPLFDSLDADQRRHAELLFFLDGTRRLRRDPIRKLIPYGLEVRGDDGWREVCERPGPAISYRYDLPVFYRRCMLNLNATSLQMPTAINQRVFDCPAAGGFPLTDVQAALDDLFDVEREVA
jgi:spore maturation protein CgeB